MTLAARFMSQCDCERQASVHFPRLQGRGGAGADPGPFPRPGLVRHGDRLGVWMNGLFSPEKVSRESPCSVGLPPALPLLTETRAAAPIVRASSNV